MKKVLIVITLLFTIFSFQKVNARELCTSSTYGKLKREAYNVNFSYEMKKDANGSAYFVITVMNFKEDLLLIVGDSVYEYENVGDTFKLNNTFDGGETITFSVYGGYDTPCVEEFLYSKKVKIPKYNIYSEEEECFEYDEFELCNKWYQGQIPSRAYFLEKLDEYIQANKPKEPEKEPEDTRSVFEKAIDLYLDNLIIAIPITVVVVGLILFIVIRKIIRKKQRVKLDFDFKV